MSDLTQRLDAAAADLYRRGFATELVHLVGEASDAIKRLQNEQINGKRAHDEMYGRNNSGMMRSTDD